MPTPDTNWALPLIELNRCTGCGLCEQLCSTNAVEVHQQKAVIVRPQDCSYCDLCESYCPEGAIRRPFHVVFAPADLPAEQDR